MKIIDKLRGGLGKDILTTLVSQGVVLLLALVVNKVLSVRLGVEGYGEYSIIRKSTQVVSFVMLAGMGIALPRFMPMRRAKEGETGYRSVVSASVRLVGLVSLAVAMLLVAFRGISEPLLTGGSHKALFYPALLYAFSMTTSSWLYAYYRGKDAFVRFGVSQVVVQILVVTVAFLSGSNLLLMLNAWSLATLVFVLFSLLLELRKPASGWVQQEKSGSSGMFRKLAVYGMPRMLGDLFLFSFSAFPMVFINQKIGMTASSHFAAGLTLTSLVTPLFAYLGMVLLPYVSTSMASDRFHQAERLISRLFVLYLVLSLLAVAVLWLGMEPLLRLFFSEHFLPSAGVARLLGLSVVFEAIYLLLRNPIDAVSVFPYNTVNLGISLFLLAVLFFFCTTETDFALAFVVVSFFKALLSGIAWRHCKRRIAV